MNVRPRAVSNCAGLGENDTRRMLLAATPASRRPGLRLLRGSDALGYDCADASAGATRVAMSTSVLHELRIRTNSGDECGGASTGKGGSLWGKLGLQLLHDAYLDGLRGEDVVREYA